MVYIKCMVAVENVVLLLDYGVVASAWVGNVLSSSSSSICDSFFHMNLAQASKSE